MNRRETLGMLSAGLLQATSGTAHAKEDTFDLPAAAALAAYQGFVEQYLADVQSALKIVASTEEARSGKWKGVRPVIAAMASSIPAQAAVWYALPDGSYSTAEKGPTGETLADREYFPDLLAGRSVMGSLVISKSTGHRSIIVAEPVLSGLKMVAAVGASVRARLLSSLVEEATAMPPDLVLYTLDPRGQTVLHRNPDRMFQYPSEQGDPSLANAVKRILAEPSGTITYSYGGKAREGVFSGWKLTGWKFVLVKETA